MINLGIKAVLLTTLYMLFKRILNNTKDIRVMKSPQQLCDHRLDYLWWALMSHVKMGANKDFLFQ